MIKNLVCVVEKCLRKKCPQIFFFEQIIKSISPVVNNSKQTK